MFALAGNLQQGLVTNMMFDSKALNGTIATVLNANNTTLRNMDVDHFNITKDVSTPYSPNKPGEWDGNTVMNAPFDNGSIAAGNADFFGSQITSILIQRQRMYKDNVSEWVTIFEYDPNSGSIMNPENPLNFSIEDRFAAYGETYRYRLLPVLIQGNTQYQSEGGISDPITSIFDGVFICDKNSGYRLFAQVEFDSMTVHQDIGTHVTLGNQYPIIVANSKAAYRTGGISGMVLPDDFGKVVPQIREAYNIECLNDCETTGSIDKNFGSTILKRVGLNREDMVEKRQELERFFTSKTPKVIKDWNGNMWLVIFTDDPSVSFDSSWGMGLATVNAGWTEIGDPNSEDDLRYAGMIGGNK